MDWDELPRWTMIDKALSLESPDPAETYSNSPHLYDELGIPAEAGGAVGVPRRSQGKRRDADRTGPAERQGDEKSGRARSRPPRRRTRGGQPATGHPAGANGEATPKTPETPSGEPAGSAGTPRRRRRRRKPASQTTAATAATAN